MKKIIRNLFGNHDGVYQRVTVATLCVMLGMLVISVSCKKDVVSKENITFNDGYSPIKKMVIPEDVFTDVIQFGELKNVYPVIKESLCNSYKVFGVFSLDEEKQNIRYGFISEINNKILFEYLFERFQIKQLDGECNEWKEFDDLEEALEWLEQGLAACCDITIFQTEIGTYIVILEPDPDKSLPPYDNVLNRSCKMSDIQNYLYMMQHHVGVLGEFAIFSSDKDENGDDIVEYGYFIKEHNEKLFNFLLTFVKKPMMMMGTGPGGCENWISTSDKEKIKQFVKEELEKGYIVTITCHESDGVYTAASWEKQVS